MEEERKGKKVIKTNKNQYRIKIWRQSSPDKLGITSIYFKGNFSSFILTLLQWKSEPQRWN